MNRQIWGAALFLLGLLVVADGLFGLVQQNTGMIRFVYMGLGIILVIRGLFLWLRR